MELEGKVDYVITVNIKMLMSNPYKEFRCLYYIGLYGYPPEPPALLTDILLLTMQNNFYPLYSLSRKIFLKRVFLYSPDNMRLMPPQTSTESLNDH